MNITRDKQGDAVVFDVQGAVHLEHIHELRNVLKETLEAGEVQVIVRLALAEAISSGGVGALLNYHQELAKGGGKLVLADLSRECSYVLELLRLTDFFNVVDDVPAGLKLLAEGD